ncbi:hypothetical protein K1719_044018 [Acacia pycnantha]|nr:hypothetical protein K1719_044018 [Acacia pycnantha]
MVTIAALSPVMMVMKGRVTGDREGCDTQKAIEEAAEKCAQLVVLPEIWSSPYLSDSFPLNVEDIDVGGDASPSTAMLSEVSRLLKIMIVGGSIPECYESRIYNTCCVFGTDGKLKEKHHKIHLFDIDIPGKITFVESKTLTAGEAPTIVDTYINMCQFEEVLATTEHEDGNHHSRNRLFNNIVCQFEEVLATTEHEDGNHHSRNRLFNNRAEEIKPLLTKKRRGDLYQLVDFQRLNSQ